MDIKVIVAAHKPYRMPKDIMYLPLHVGRALVDQDLGWQGDNTGDNISLKNPYYCELTGLYWAWKNLKADAIGLVHYRRFFMMNSSSTNLLCHSDKNWDKILTYIDAEKLLSRYPIILPKNRHYYIETIESQYAHAHNIEHLRKVREIIQEYKIDYLEAFDKHMSERSSHMFNMFIMRYEYFYQYCSWLFNILFELEKVLTKTERTFGFIGERLLDVWLIKHNLSYTEKEIIYMENQHLLKKYKNFLKRFIVNIKI